MKEKTNVENQQSQDFCKNLVKMRNPERFNQGKSKGIIN